MLINYASIGYQPWPKNVVCVNEEMLIVTF